MSASKKRASASMESGTTTDLQYQIFVVANNLEPRVRFINAESMNIVRLCATSRNGVITPKKASENVKAQLLRLELYIQWLETNVEIPPALKERTQIDKVLRQLFDRPDFHFQEKTRDRARALCEIWNAQNWGEGEVVEDGSDDDGSSDEETAINSKKQKSSSSNAIAKHNLVSDTGNIWLYRVVAIHLKTNKRSGLYEQFELERLEGQPPLSDIVKSRPTAREVVDFGKRKNGF